MILSIFPFVRSSAWKKKQRQAQIAQIRTLPNGQVRCIQPLVCDLILGSNLQSPILIDALHARSVPMKVGNLDEAQQTFTGP